MAKRTGVSLEARLCALIFGTVFVVILGVGHVAMREYRAETMRQYTSTFESHAHSLAVNAKNLAADAKSESAESVLSHMKTSGSDLVYVTVSDSEGDTLFASSKTTKNTHAPTGIRWWIVVRKLVGYSPAPDSVHSVSIPISLGNGEKGTFTAGFSTDRIKQSVNEVQARVLFSICIGLAAGLFLAMTMAKTMSRGVQSLIVGARAVAAGDLSYRVSPGAWEEMGALSESFNQMVASLEESYRQLVERANTDSLTRLHNHRYFQEWLSEEVNRAARYGHSLSLLMLDIDFFKTFNDEQGHPAGDTALRDLGQILIQSIRGSDVAARYGGEEFAIVLPETSLDDALATAERIRESVANHKFTGRDGNEIQLTVSIGCAEYPSHCADRTTLILAADIALYQAKAQGRNRVSAYDINSPGIPQADPYKLYVLLNAYDLPTIEALAEAVDAKLRLPSGHSHAVAQMSSAIAKKFHMSESECMSIHLASLMRDVGQIAIPDSILMKTRKLTKQEMSIVATHPSLGHSIVQKAPHLAVILPAIMHHHERFDGTGYPSMLSGIDIPLPARIIAVADAYQAMIIERPHRPKMTSAQARRELLSGASTQFDPEVVKVALQVLDEADQSDEAA